MARLTPHMSHHTSQRSALTQHRSLSPEACIPSPGSGSTPQTTSALYLSLASTSGLPTPGCSVARSKYPFGVKNLVEPVTSCWPPRAQKISRTDQRVHAAKKPIGMCCIAPVIAAHVLKATVTVGEAEGAKWPYGGTVGAVEAYGGTHQAAPFDGVCVDAENMVVTSPAYMYEGQPHEVFDSVGVMVSETLRLQTLQVSERLR